MGMSMKYSSSDSLEIMLGSISRDCQKAGLNAQKAGARAVKKSIERKLAGIKYLPKTKSGEGKRRRQTHMCDDVVISAKTDGFGDAVVKVQGGKSTGTLWHIVNDGTYKNAATHFMDTALSEVEQELESIVDASLKREFE